MPDIVHGHRDALAFVASGLVHRLGNTLFTIQGQAQLRSGTTESYDSILNAAARGGETLTVVRTLMGPNEPTPRGAAPLLEEVAELVRVPAREAGHAVEVAVSGEVDRSVDAAGFCPAVIEAIRLLLSAAPDGQDGCIRIELAEVDGAVVVAVKHRAQVGELPFPLEFARVQRQLQESLAELRSAPAVGLAGDVVELSFGPIAGDLPGGLEA